MEITYNIHEIRKIIYDILKDENIINDIPDEINERFSNNNEIVETT